jgi:hypothetical protein
MLITIRGSNLANATSVTVGGGALENLIVVDDRTLTGNVPEHANGPADIRVTTSGGTALLPSGFTYGSCTAAAGTALRFTGAQRVVFGNGTTIYENTLEAWVKVVPGARTGHILTVQTTPDNRCGEGFHLWGDGALYYAVDHAGCGTGQTLRHSGPATSVWTHVAGTFDGTDMALYVNGRLVQRAVVTRQWPIPSARYGISGDYSFCCGMNAFYTGDLDELRIWNRARTPQEIRDGMHRQLRGDEPGLVGYWRLDEGSGTQARPTGVGTIGTLGAGAGVPQWIPSGAILCAGLPGGQSGNVVDQGGGCGGGGTAAVAGAPAIGNCGFRILLQGADLASPAALLVLGDHRATVACGTCVILVPMITLGQPVVGGAATATVPVPCEIGLMGSEIGAQWLVVGTSASPCGLARNVSASNRLRLILGS